MEALPKYLGAKEPMLVPRWIRAPDASFFALDKHIKVGAFREDSTVGMLSRGPVILSGIKPYWRCSLGLISMIVR